MPASGLAAQVNSPIWFEDEASALSSTPASTPAIAAEVASSAEGSSPASMLRNEVPPPAPAVMPSISRPAALSMPVSSATAHGSVATSRPYWLTVILAAKAGVTASIIAAVAKMARNGMALPPVVAVERVACSLYAQTLYIRLSITRKVGPDEQRAPQRRAEERHEARARRSGGREDPHPAASPGHVPP